MKSDAEVCTECQTAIPGEKTPYLWRGSVVCEKCYRSLNWMNGAEPPKKPEQCDNCSRPFGKLEKPQRFEDHWVCAACLPLLKAGQMPNQEDTDRDIRGVTSAPSAVVSRSYQAGEVICPNPHCGRRVIPVRKSRGSYVVLILLLILMILPGLLYLVFMSGYDYFCPHCGIKLRSEIR